MRKKKPTPVQIEEFIIQIDMIKEEHNCSAMEAVIIHCESIDIDYQSVVPLIKETMIGKIGQEANTLGLLKYPRPSKKKKLANVF